MKALRCPNCGGGQFEELAGKRRCIYCGAEFVVGGDEAIVARKDEVFRPVPYLGTRNCPPGTAPHYYITREMIGIKPHPISVPGIKAKGWRRQTLNRQIEDLQLTIGNAFLPLFRHFMESWRGVS